MATFSLNISLQNQLVSRIERRELTCEELLLYLEHPDASMRSDAVEILGCQRETKAIPLIHPLLKDPEKQVRIQVAIALIRMGEEPLLQDLLANLRHPDRQVVIGAALTLGRLEDARATIELAKAFATDDPEVGAAVAWALGQCKDVFALPLLISAVKHHFVPANACEALGKIGDERALNILLDALTFQDDNVRAYAARALSLLKFQSHPDQNEAVVVALRSLLQDGSRKVRMCAAISLYQLNHHLEKHGTKIGEAH